MLQRELTREQVMQVGEQILINMKEMLIERGYHYFSEGRVYNTQVHEGTLLTSNVQGTWVYQVSIDLEAFPNSTCTCLYAHFCKHIAATFFQMYCVFDNPRNFLQAAQQPRTSSFSPSMLYPAVKKQLIAPLRKPATLPGARVAETGSVNDWWRFLENRSRNLFSAMEINRASSELYNSYKQALGITFSWPEELAQLFTIHANLFHLLILQDYVKKNHASYWLPDLAQTAVNLVQQLEDTLYCLNVAPLKELCRPYLEETLVRVKELKYCDSSSIYWIQAYQLLWRDLLQEPSWIEAEVTELEQLINEPGLSPSIKEKYRILKAHFSVMNGKDAEALNVWSQHEELTLPFYLMYLKAFARHNEWNRFLDWMDWLERLIGKAEPSDYRLAIGIWQHAMAQVGRTEECGPMLKKFLPGSFHDYATFLFEQKQYKQWLDLQMSFQVRSSEISSLSIKVIDAENPTLLLPFYVREVNRLIGERNRAAYLEAVKLLKKIRSCYNQANQEEVWERFIHQLSAKHYRLRAFQEELRRGNVHS